MNNKVKYIFLSILVLGALFGAFFIGSVFNVENTQQIQKEGGTLSDNDNVEFKELSERMLLLESVVRKNSEIMLKLAKQSTQSSGHEILDVVNDEVYQPTSIRESVKVPEPKSMAELVSDTYDSLSNSITRQGESPQNTLNIETALKNLNETKPERVNNVTFDKGACSEDRCVIQADVSGSQFSAEKLAKDLTFTAGDDYYRLMNDVSNEIAGSFGKKTQVSFYRSGDRVVMDVKVPTESRNIGKGDG